MPAVHFNRDSTARWYAKQYLKTDPGVTAIYYLPTGASDREIRLLEVNELIASRNQHTLEPIEFGVDRGQESEHELLVLDLTPGQWNRVNQGELDLPGNWSLDLAVPFKR